MPPPSPFHTRADVAQNSESKEDKEAWSKMLGVPPASRVEAAMTSADVQAIIRAELGDNWSQSNAHGVDLRECLVPPRKVACRNTFPKLNGGRPLELWIVLEETPGRQEGYLIVFDETQHVFGLALSHDETPVFLGFHGTFLSTLQGM